MREYDLTIATENVFAELLDLQASESLGYEVEAHEIVELLEKRYHALWSELTAEEEFSASEMWRIEQRIERLNDLGFDVDELDIVTDFDGDRVRIQPKVVEAGHHQRELQGLTGLHVEDAQARRLLNDLASFTAALDLGREDRTPGREPVARRDLRADRRDGPRRRHAASSSRRRSSTRSSQHRWYLSERGRPRGRHLRGRRRLHRQRAEGQAGRGDHRGPERAVDPTLTAAADAARRQPRRVDH